MGMMHLWDTQGHGLLQKIWLDYCALSVLLEDELTVPYL